MRCPRCDDEYEDGVTSCVDCDVPLVPADTPAGSLVAGPRVDTLLGTFHPGLIAPIVDLLQRRGVEHQILPSGTASDRETGWLSDSAEVIVDRAWRDDLRAELTVTWDELLRRADPTVVAELPTGGRLAGWYDAPDGAWVDRLGRLQVDPGGDDEAIAESRRVVGPALVAAGVLVALLGWYTAGAPGWIALGIVAAIVGLIVPR